LDILAWLRVRPHVRIRILLAPLLFEALKIHLVRALEIAPLILVVGKI
jgi:hypothetical protein